MIGMVFQLPDPACPVVQLELQGYSIILQALHLPPQSSLALLQAAKLLHEDRDLKNSGDSAGQTLKYDSMQAWHILLLLQLLLLMILGTCSQTEENHEEGTACQ